MTIAYVVENYLIPSVDAVFDWVKAIYYSLDFSIFTFFIIMFGLVALFRMMSNSYSSEFVGFFKSQSDKERANNERFKNSKYNQAQRDASQNKED